MAASLVAWEALQRHEVSAVLSAKRVSSGDLNFLLGSGQPGHGAEPD